MWCGLCTESVIESTCNNIDVQTDSFKTATKYRLKLNTTDILGYQWHALFPIR